ncbi:hypothetical protein J7M22_08675 [Candidatus Poribacteria bacterium]|nr:hypothetical protein [Candidatus Poribacteria bacterium]
MKDEHLIQKAISGDSSAFCKLVEKYFDSVCSALCSLITDPFDAEEIAQEAFLRAYLHLRKPRRPSSFRSSLQPCDGSGEMDREMMRKWVFEGRSYGDLSEEYNMSYDAVAKRIRRGRLRGELP